MKIDNLEIIAQLERLAEACPWDSVDIWIRRKPEGEYRFTAYVFENAKLGMPSVFGNGHTPEEAVTDALKQSGGRDPEILRKRKIAELQEQIEKLQAVVIGLPPYRPNRELGYIKAPETVDV